MEDIILLGGGGHCKSVIDTIKALDKYKIIGILDLAEKVGTSIDEVKVIGTDQMLEGLYSIGMRNVHISLGSIDNPNNRRKLYQYAKDIGYTFPNIVDKTSIIGSNVSIGEGTFIGKGCIINTDSIVGNHSIINSGVIIEHDCNIGDFCHVAPGSTLSGGVLIGKNTHIGTNTTVIQNISIGMNTMIGAGSVVVKDIKDNTKAFGNPCREVL